MVTAARHAQLSLAALQLNQFCALTALAVPQLQDALAVWRSLVPSQLDINVGMEVAKPTFSSAQPELPN